jgi:hypothetical protein
MPQKNAVIEYLRKDRLDRGWISVGRQLRDALVGSLWEIYANAIMAQWTKERATWYRWYRS